MIRNAHPREQYLAMLPVHWARLKRKYVLGVARHARAVDSGSTARKQPLLFMIRNAHPRVQYLAMLPVHWARLEKEKSKVEAAMLLGHLTVQKVTGSTHFAFCFWSDAVGCNVLQ